MEPIDKAILTKIRDDLYIYLRAVELIERDSTDSWNIGKVVDYIDITIESIQKVLEEH